MDKNEFYLKAMASGVYKKKSWTLSAFSIIREDFSKWKEDPYPYRVVQTQTGFFFVSPDNTEALIPIENTKVGEPVFNFKDPIELEEKTLPNLNKKITSTIGNVFFNYCCIVEAFGTAIEYQEGLVSIDKLENRIAKVLTDNPPDGAPREDGVIYVENYVKFVDACCFITAFSQLCTWGATAKLLLPPPGLKEYKATLAEKYKGRLHDPAVVAAYDADLVKYDAEFLKGDPGMGFLIKSKSREIVRKKLFLAYGAEVGIKEKVGVTLIKNSLNEGWEVDKFPDMNNALRAGVFNRGAETMLGGESVKWLLRASSNIVVTKEDCGSRFGKQMDITDANLSKLVGFSIVTKEGYKSITSNDEAGSYLGKRVMVRSPMYCKLTKTDYCSVCIGDKLSKHPKGLSLAVSSYGSAFLYIFMSGAHSKGLMLAKMNYKTALK